MLNQISSVGAFLLGASTLPFLFNVFVSRHTPVVNADDPWGRGRSLEWTTGSPPPRHNFETIPRIWSEAPAFDIHHPEVAALEARENPEATEDADRGMVDAPEQSARPEHLEQRLSDESHDPDDDGLRR
ncbi:MAG: ctaD [Nocardioides sp.]|nr:ctaD [Nocardioides sp.]